MGMSSVMFLLWATLICFVHDSSYGKEINELYYLRQDDQPPLLNLRWDVVSLVHGMQNTPATSAISSHVNSNDNGIPAIQFIGQPVYVSLTVISKRVKRLDQVIWGLLRGSVIPTHIYVFISNTKYLIDEGVREIPEPLLDIAARYPSLLSFVYVENTGPHRKLLPLLYKKWNEDCVIITVDDDTLFPAVNNGSNKTSSLVESFLVDYNSSNRNAIVASRVRRIGLCTEFPHNILRFVEHWLVIEGQGRKEMLLLPTGTGGILYRPRFFHPIIFDDRLRLINNSTDDIMFRLTSMIRKVPVVIGCRRLGHCSKTLRILDQNSNPVHLKNSFHESVRRLSAKSLWYLVNLHGRNENNFQSSIQYMQDTIGFTFSSIAAKYLSIDRPSECFRITSTNPNYFPFCSMMSCVNKTDAITSYDS